LQQNITPPTNVFSVSLLYFVLILSQNSLKTMDMPTLSTVFGALFVALGGGAFAMTQAPTSLIPAGIGAIMILLSRIAAQKENLRKHLMHAVVVLALVGFLASVTALPKLAQMLSGAEIERPAGVIVRSIMAVLSAVFTGLAVKSFIDARKAKA
jgi:protein-S-isoprenylcysteine O-methyltransferase Ste14